METTFKSVILVRDGEGKILGFIDSFNDGSGANYVPTFTSLGEETNFSHGELTMIAEHIRDLSR